jgi:hypothetical protein
MRAIKDRAVLRVLEDLIGFYHEMVIHRNLLDSQMRIIGLDAISIHHHERAMEWYVIDKGAFQVILGDGTVEEFHCETAGQSLILLFEPKERHGAIPLSHVYMWVLKNFADEAVF